MGEAPADPRLMDRAVLFKLLSTPPETLRRLPDVSEGLENRFLKAAEKAKTAEALLGMVKTKRYTLSRLRRILWNLMLENREALTASLPLYPGACLSGRDRAAADAGDRAEGGPPPLHLDGGYPPGFPRNCRGGAERHKTFRALLPGTGAGGRVPAAAAAVGKAADDRSDRIEEHFLGAAAHRSCFASL